MDPPRSRRQLALAVAGIFLTSWVILLLPFNIRLPPLTSPPKVKVSQRSKAATILLVISTTSKNYNRVVSIRDTWMKRVVEKSSIDIIFVGDSGPELFPDLIQSACKVGYWEDSCKRGEMFTFSYDYLKSSRGQFIDWVYYADDDVYIFPDNLQRMIMSLGPGAVNESKAWGIPGCAHDKCTGFCGGAGYFTNRDTVVKIEEGVDRTKYTHLSDEAGIFDEGCGRYGDISISSVIREHRGIPLVKYPEGSYAWSFVNGEVGLIASLQNTNPRPWLYHYPSRGRMDFIHQKGIEFHTDLRMDEE